MKTYTIRILALIVLFFFSSNSQFAFAANCRRTILINSIDIETLPATERLKLFDQYSQKVEEVKAIFEYATQIAARHPGITFVGVTMGDVSVRKKEDQSAKPSTWKVHYSGTGTISFGVSNKRSPREEKYAELTFAKNELSWLQFRQSSSSISKSDYQSLQRRVGFAKDRIVELESQLRRF